MEEIVWQLPINSNRSFYNEIHHKTKYHAFKNDKSLCGKYAHDSDFFETNPQPDEKLTKETACNKCLKKMKIL